MKRLVVSREKNSIRFRNRSRIAVTVAVTVTVTTVTELSMLPCKTKEVELETIVSRDGRIKKLIIYLCRMRKKLEWKKRYVFMLEVFFFRVYNRFLLVFTDRANNPCTVGTKILTS